MMNKIVLGVLMTCSLNCAAQESEQEAVKQVVNQFFDSLEEQDTVLYKSTLFPEGQVWRLRNNVNPPSLDMRHFRDDIGSFSDQVDILETPLSYEIKIHQGLAMAWVPYEFHVNGKFSHCGVDVFTLIQTQDGWKIVSAAYTIEQEGCIEKKQ